MTRLLKSVLVGAMFVAGLATTAAAQQRPTPEGTAINNVATASYTDARGNQYEGVSSNTATITVGFKGAPAVSGASATPAPNTTNYIAFTIANVGNGRDTLRVESDAVASGVTLTGNYRYAGNVYASRALLNAALAGVQVDTAGGTNPSIVVEVEYDVATTAGSIDLVAGSTRDLTSLLAERTALGTATINAPVLTYDVSVTAPADASIQAGTNTYGEFTVTNASNVAASFGLAAAIVSDAAATIVDIRNTSNAVITSTTLLNPGASMTVRVHYSMPAKILTPANNVVGEEATITLTATGEGAASGASDSDDVVYTISEPVGSLEFTKVALTDAEVELQPADRVLPGQFIKYRITITQPLTAVGNLASITVTDALSENLIWVSTTAETGTWAASTFSVPATDEDGAGPSTRMVGGTLSIPFTGSLTPGSSASVIIRVQVR